MSVTALRQPDLAVFPMLTEMGVRRFHEISHYRLRQDGPRGDVLKVHYKRQKGSLLPVTRKYAFGRSLKTVVVDGGTSRMEDTFEISPYLLDAVTELDALVAQNRLVDVAERAPRDEKAVLLDELDALRRDVVRKLSPAEAGTVAVRFEGIARRLEAI